MKKLAGLVIILAVLILGGYYGMGVLTERTIKQNIAIINQNNGLLVDIEQYNRSLFCANALVRWRINVPERIVKDDNGNSKTVPGQSYQMEMPIKIYHGPIIFSKDQVRFGIGYAETALVLPEKYSKQFDEQFTKASIKPQLDLSIFVNYFLHSSVDMSLPSFKLIDKNGGTFDWKGMDAVFSLSSNKDKVDGKILLDGMAFSKDPTQVNINKVAVDYNLHATPANLYLGDARFSLPSFDVTEKGKNIFNVKDFSINSNSDIANSLFSTHFNLGLVSLLVNEKKYGPGELEIVLRNIDADALAQINQQATEMQNSSDADRQKAMMAILPQLPKLLSKGPEIEISKCSLKVPEGNIDGNLLLKLPVGESNNPFDIIQKMQGHAIFRMPAAMLKQLMQQSVLQQLSTQPDLQQILLQQLQQNANTNLTKEQIAALQADRQLATMGQSGLITSSGSDYVIELNLEKGKLIVNGRAFDPAMLKF